MKKKWVFILGMLAGVLLTITILAAVQYLPELMRNSNTDEVMQERRDSLRLAAAEEMRKREELQYLAQNVTFDEKSVKVFQVIQSVYNDQALVYGKNEYGAYIGTLYLLEYGMNMLYDGQIIKIPKGMVLRLVGKYQYVTTDGGYKTVPKVRITNKDKYERSADSI